MQRLFCLFFLVWLILPACAAKVVPHENIELNALFLQGKEAYELRDYDQAIKYLLPAAQKGQRDAQYYVAVLYDFGLGVKADDQEAAGWYYQAATQGHADAQFNLAIAYERGTGLAQDDMLAIYWYTQAAENGVADAQRTLGICYLDGKLVEQDTQSGRMWLEKAASQGDTKAIDLLLKME